MISVLTRTGVASVLTLMAGTPAFAATAPVSPISISSCDYENVPSATADGDLGPAPIYARNLRITFANESPVTATDVRFGVQYAHRSQVVDTTGTFSTGASIAKDFDPATAPMYNGSAACTVQSVTFSDGSTWPPA
jgi:hypothetical protein